MDQKLNSFAYIVEIFIEACNTSSTKLTVQLNARTVGVFRGQLAPAYGTESHNGINLPGVLSESPLPIDAQKGVVCVAPGAHATLILTKMSNTNCKQRYDNNQKRKPENEQ
ncbi:hypothetical protein WP1W18C01_39280 [Stenotrophomonas maltophilia]|nr:hypothetical protein WP1W18C01_39280 [Stenotrophomonas maltophilia]